MSNHNKLPWLGCHMDPTKACCPDRQFGCCDISANRYNAAGPAELTNEWNIGCRSCIGNLKKCKGSCGNNYCSSTGQCDGNVDAGTHYITEGFRNNKSSFVGVL